MKYLNSYCVLTFFFPKKKEFKEKSCVFFVYLFVLSLSCVREKEYLTESGGYKNAVVAKPRE